MPTGLTYVRGRVQADTTESGTTTRVAGQFTAPFLSCPVRAADSARVRIPEQVTPTSGAVIIYFDPDNNHNAGGQPASGGLFEWWLDASNYFYVKYDKSLTRYEFHRAASSGTGTTNVNLTDTFNAATGKALYIGWDAANIYIAVDGGSISSVANAKIPAVVSSTIDIGYSVNVSTTRFEAAYGAVLQFAAPLTTAQWSALAALRTSRPPLMGERSGSAMTGLWYGGHQATWNLASTGGAVDLNDTDDGDFRLLGVKGAGSAPILHRVVETPLRDGAAYIDARLRPRQIALTLLLQGVNGWADTWAKRRELLAALNPRLGRGVLMFAPDVQVYEIDAVLESGLEFSNALGPFTQQADALLRCDDPAWRVAVLNEQTVTSLLSGVTVSLVVPMTVTAGTGNVNVQNGGDLPAYPEVRMTMSGQTVERPRIARAGTTFTLADAYAVGDVVTVDMEERTAVNAAGTSLMGKRTSDSQMWALEPGANAVEVAQGSGAISARLRWPTRLLGI